MHSISLFGALDAPNESVAGEFLAPPSILTWSFRDYGFKRESGPDGRTAPSLGCRIAVGALASPISFLLGARSRPARECFLRVKDFCGGTHTAHKVPFNHNHKSHWIPKYFSQFLPTVGYLQLAGGDFDGACRDGGTRLRIGASPTSGSRDLPLVA
ncbi:hypothetical protein C2845_PM15G05190 [Panicum miliaceum]|uniref:Uncharacterized protein n=1 Tax=Panicum miliaceum TaxID=4540 RepID=A0A3L6QBP1_PANMI|nr:hypothetical protein C2845_PM15G05190 [Panicum miliaceum]